MTNCSRSNAAIAPKIMKQVQTKLKDIQTVYPGTKGCCIISNGECLIETVVESSKDTTELIRQIKATAVKFGEALKEKDECNLIHIQGDRNLFSLYLVAADQVLAFYTAMDSKTSQTFNFTAADEQMKNICQDLLQLLHNTKFVT